MRQSSEVRSRIVSTVVLGLIMIVVASGSVFANPGVAGLKRATAAFHSIDVAMAAGWDTSLTPCMESPAGGMGYHYGNLSLFDGVVDALRPETILYEPMKNGSLRLVAVEYIVPTEAWSGAEPPSLFGRDFHDNGSGLWILHVWAWRNNPTGMFEDWNPKVTCDYAE